MAILSSTVGGVGLLSRRWKEAIKTGLAMAIAFGIALAMDWEKPYWAGFAVAMISLSTVGQSLNKGAMRMLGTLVAVAVALTLLALFPQDRWLLMIALSIYLAVCTYMLTGKRYQYAWFVAAFVCLTIMVHGGTDSQNAFRYAVARVEETALGILVYSLVSIFLWPVNTRDDLGKAARALLATQRRVHGAYRDLMAGRGSEADTRSLRLQELQGLRQLGQSLTAAQLDTYEVWELRHAWRRLLQQAGQPVARKRVLCQFTSPAAEAGFGR